MQLGCLLGRSPLPFSTVLYRSRGSRQDVGGCTGSFQLFGEKGARTKSWNVGGWKVFRRSTQCFWCQPEPADSALRTIKEQPTIGLCPLIRDRLSRSAVCFQLQGSSYSAKNGDSRGLDSWIRGFGGGWLPDGATAVAVFLVSARACGLRDSALRTTGGDQLLVAGKRLTRATRATGVKTEKPPRPRPRCAGRCRGRKG